MTKGLNLSSLLAVTLVIFILGCSGAGNDPVMPGTGEMGDTPADITTPSETQSATGDPGEEYDPVNQKVLWGLYDITIDPSTGTAEFVPLRASEFTFNINQFLQPPGGNPANLGLTVVDASQYASTGRIDLDISLTHPFPTLPKFRGFDVMGVLMGNGSISGWMDSTVLYAAAGTDPILLNADGYTRWMNATEFTTAGLLGFTPGSKGIPGFVPTATINGYKYYSEFLGSTDDLSTFFQTQTNVDARGSFKAGSTLTRRFEINFPLVGGSPQLRFQYAVLANWAAADPASLPNPGVNDFPLTANLGEPFHMSVTDNGTDMYYIDPATFGGNLRINLEVFDWQAASNAGVSSELIDIFIEESTGNVLSGGYYGVLSTTTAIAGNANSSVYQVDVATTPTAAGRLEFLVTAESLDPMSYNQGLGATVSSANRSAYARFTVMVGNSNPCPAPDMSSSFGKIVNVGDIVTPMPLSGTGLVAGPSAAAAWRNPSATINGTNVSITSATAAQADFDFTGAPAGMYNLQFTNGCGTPALPVLQALEINTPPTSTGITGASTGDGTLGVQQYNANASDVDTNPVDTLSYTWNVTDLNTMTPILGPVTGDPLNLDFATLPLSSMIDVACDVSDGYAPADINLHYTISRTNTQPSIGTPTGQTPVWYTKDQYTYNVVASDLDASQTLTYMWSVVPSGNPASYVNTGDPTPGQFTIDYDMLLVASGSYDISCEVDDGSAAPNAKNQSPVLTIYVADDPYTGPFPSTYFNQVLAPGLPSLQGMGACPSFWDSFYGPTGTVPFIHADISIISGPSLVGPGRMLINDEAGVYTGPLPAPPPVVCGWAEFTCPYAFGNMPSFSWLSTGLAPAGPDMFPSVVHFDSNSAGEMLITSAQMANKLPGLMIPDPSTFQHELNGGVWLDDLYTSSSVVTPDIAADCTGGFDMGSPSSPMIPPMYGFYTQDLSGVLFSCGGPIAMPLSPNPVQFMMFPAGATQPFGVAVDVPGSAAVVAPLPTPLVGPGPGLFNILPGTNFPSGPSVFPDAFYALAIDDDPSDNFVPSSLPQPVTQWTIAAAIDSDRDVELYEIDFGFPPPGPAPIMPLMTLPMGSFLGGSPTAFPVDVEFISNFSGFAGTPKPIWQEELLAVLSVDTVPGVWAVEIFSLNTGLPTLVGMSMAVPTPPGIWPVGGVAFSLDVDEVTGDIYVLHEDTVGGGTLTVTIFPY